MPGRRGSTVIIDPNEILTLHDIQNEEIWCMETLLDNTANDGSALEWCVRRRLIKNSMNCPNCNELCTLLKNTNGIDSFRWGCPVCKFKKSVREGSFFYRSHLTVRNIIIAMYMWCRDHPQYRMAREAHLKGSKIAIVWCNYMREECAKYLEKYYEEIGGTNEDGEAIVVEIDVGEFFLKRNQRGQKQDGVWVLGGVERESGKCFLVEVPDRNADTLKECIRRHVLPGTHIVSDGRASFANIEDIDDGIYQHSFNDPNDSFVHIQNIGNLWIRVRRKLEMQFGTNRALFKSYLKEFEYRNYTKNDDMFRRFLKTISENYQLNIP